MLQYETAPRRGHAIVEHDAVAAAEDVAMHAAMETNSGDDAIAVVMEVDVGYWFADYDAVGIAADAVAAADVGGGVVDEIPWVGQEQGLEHAPTDVGFAVVDVVLKRVVEDVSCNPKLTKHPLQTSPWFHACSEYADEP